MPEGDFNPDRLLVEAAPQSAAMSIRPKRLNGTPYPEVISPVMGELLNHLQKGESAGRYDITYGNHVFQPGGDHPRIAVPIKEGPNAGRTSSAAGAYQFIGPTWDNVSAKTGLKEMTPENQDINAAFLANETYRKATGRDLQSDWASGDPRLRHQIDQVLSSQWESLGKPGPRADKLPGYRFSDKAWEQAEAPDTKIMERARNMQSP